MGFIDGNMVNFVYEIYKLEFVRGKVNGKRKGFI